MVIVLHASVIQGRMVLWAESAVEGQRLIIKRSRRGASRSRPRKHPFVVEARPLVRLFQALHIEHPKVKGPPVIAFLPAVCGMPWPSCAQIAEPPQTHFTPEPAPFFVPVLHLTIDAMVELLCHCAAKQTELLPGVLIGTDLAFFARALLFVSSLVIDQHFLPGVELSVETNEEGESKPSSHATWQLLLGANERESLEQLLSTMPASARALTLAVDGQLPTPKELFDAFSQLLLDHFVRGATHRHVEQDARRRFQSVHDQWLYALQARDSHLEGKPDSFTQLALNVSTWRAPLDVMTQSHFRLRLRLEEPISERTNTWQVRYFVQPCEDPSLHVPVEPTWQPNSPEFLVLRRYGADPRPSLLAALGEAAKVAPEIEESLRTPEPWGFNLNAAGAFHFLTETAPALEEAGFAVDAPTLVAPDPAKHDLAIRAVVHESASARVAGPLALNKLCDFEWQVAFDGEALSSKELEELARFKVPLVRVKGQWRLLSQDDLATALEAYKARSVSQATVQELLQMSLGVAPRGLGLPLEGVVATGWIADIIERLDGRRPLEEIDTPTDFVGTLRPYQCRGYAWLAWITDLGLGACLADDMGLGKTVQTLALIDRNRISGEKRPVLLVCPTSVVGNWAHEAARFTPNLKVHIHHGSGRAKGDEFAQELQGVHLVVSSYGVLVRDSQSLNSIDWAGVVLDETQNIKNPDTLQAKAARALKGGYRIALTGTPVENHLGDLWSIFDFLNPGLLDSRAKFRTKFSVPIEINHDLTATERLRKMTGPFLLRRLKTDKAIIEDLPEKNEMKVFCGLTREQASLYKAVVAETESALEESEGIQRRGVILSTLTKLKQICNHPKQLLDDQDLSKERSGKLVRLTEMIEELLSVGDKALIFTQFTQMGTIIRDTLQSQFGIEVPFLYGGVSRARREAMVEKFQSPNGPKVFVLSLKAGGTGLNLTAANHVFHFDRWWNPAVESQATDRAFRIGQEKDVQVHTFICAGTLEEAIDEMIERKKSVATDVIGQGEKWLTELSNDELREVFALRTVALGG